MRDPHLKRPIDDVNVLRMRNEQEVQMWLAQRIHSYAGPNFNTTDGVLEYIHENLAEAPVWKLRLGRIGRQRQTQITLTVATRKPARFAKGDCIGRCMQQGAIEEVWPAFVTYARML